MPAGAEVPGPCTRVGDAQQHGVQVSEGQEAENSVQQAEGIHETSVPWNPVHEHHGVEPSKPWQHRKMARARLGQALRRDEKERCCEASGTSWTGFVCDVYGPYTVYMHAYGHIMDWGASWAGIVRDVYGDAASLQSVVLTGGLLCVYLALPRTIPCCWWQPPRHVGLVLQMLPATAFKLCSSRVGPPRCVYDAYANAAGDSLHLKLVLEVAQGISVVLRRGASFQGQPSPCFSLRQAVATQVRSHHPVPACDRAEFEALALAAQRMSKTAKERASWWNGCIEFRGRDADKRNRAGEPGGKRGEAEGPQMKS
eukprot:1143426-Pelagomonas_calceolata.AAC.9